MSNIINMLAPLVPSIITSLITALATALIGYFVWIKKLERKTKMNEESMKSINADNSKLQRELNSFSARMEIETSKRKLLDANLIKKRGEMIAEVYTKLVEVHEDTTNIVRPDYFHRESPPMPEMLNKALSSYDSFYDVLSRNELYFSPDTADWLWKYHAQIQDFLKEVVIAIKQDTKLLDERGNFKDIFDKIAIRIPKVKESIVKEFRELLQVPTEQSDDEEKVK